MENKLKVKQLKEQITEKEDFLMAISKINLRVVEENNNKGDLRMLEKIDQEISNT